MLQLGIEHKLARTSHGESTARGGRRRSLVARTGSGSKGSEMVVVVVGRGHVKK